MAVFGALDVSGRSRSPDERSDIRGNYQIPPRISLRSSRLRARAFFETAARLPSACDLGNPGAVATAHQDAVLGAAEIGDAHGEPDADRGQCDRERQRRDIGEHAMAEVVRLFARTLV